MSPENGRTRSACEQESLLAVVDAALARHHCVTRVQRVEPCVAHERWAGALMARENLEPRRACPNCRVIEQDICPSCFSDEGWPQDWPCPEYRDISSVLLGKEATE